VLSLEPARRSLVGGIRHLARRDRGVQRGIASASRTRVGARAGRSGVVVVTNRRNLYPDLEAAGLRLEARCAVM